MANKDSSYDPGDYNKTGLVAFIFSFGFSIALFFVLGFFFSDIIIDEVKETPPPGSEVQKFDVTSIDKPWLVSEEMIAHGKETYKVNCQTCHGETGVGDGPGSGGMNVRNLIEGNWKQGGTSIALFETLKNGVAGTSMAGFSHIKPGSRWALVQYVRSITKNKVEDDPEKLEAYAKEQ